MRKHFYWMYLPNKENVDTKPLRQMLTDSVFHFSLSPTWHLRITFHLIPSRYMFIFCSLSICPRALLSNQPAGHLCQQHNEGSQLRLDLSPGSGKWLNSLYGLISCTKLARDELCLQHFLNFWWQTISNNNYYLLLLPLEQLQVKNIFYYYFLSVKGPRTLQDPSCL